MPRSSGRSSRRRPISSCRIASICRVTFITLPNGERPPISRWNCGISASGFSAISSISGTRRRISESRSGRADADHDPDDRLGRDPPHRLLQPERLVDRPRRPSRGRRSPRSGPRSRGPRADGTTGAISRRWCLCSSPSSRNSDCSPSTGRKIWFVGPIRNVDGSPLRTSQAASGSATNAQRFSAPSLTVKIEPWRSRLRSMNSTGSRNHWRICQRPGLDGPEGSTIRSSRE